MKKTLLSTFAVVLVILSSCCSTLGNDVKELRTLHRAYRDRTVARNPTETATVEAIGDSLERSMKKLEELTR